MGTASTERLTGGGSCAALVPERRVAAPGGAPRETNLPHAIRPRGPHLDARLARSAPPAPPRRPAEPSGATSQPARDDCGIEEFTAALESPSRLARLSTMVAGVARARYGIRADDAQDVFQEAVLTYLVIRGRFPRDANHFGLLVGIFHRKALHALTAARRRARGMERLATRIRNDRRELDDQHAPDAAAIHEEQVAVIRGAIDAIGQDARETLLALATGRGTRLGLIAQMGINRNTFDSRLHQARAKLRRRLALRGAF